MEDGASVDDAVYQIHVILRCENKVISDGAFHHRREPWNLYVLRWARRLPLLRASGIYVAAGAILNHPIRKYQGMETLNCTDVAPKYLESRRKSLCR